MAKKLTRQQKINLGLSKPEHSKYKLKKENFSNPVFVQNYVYELSQAIQDTKPEITLIDEIFGQQSQNMDVGNLVGLIGEGFVNHWINEFSNETMPLGDSSHRFKNGVDKSEGTEFLFSNNKENLRQMEIDNMYSFQGFNGFVEVKTSPRGSMNYTQFNRKVERYLSKQDEVFGESSGIMLLFGSRNVNSKNPL